MRRREFIGGLASAVAWPLAASGQQPAMPVIGLLNGVSFEAYADSVAAFRQGLKETGFIEGQNVTIEYRSADGRFERMPALATDLVRRQVAVIVGIGGDIAPQSAKAATSSIPIIFATGGDALDSGLVASLNRPEANVTGVSFANDQLSPKRLQLMRELLPAATVIGFLRGNPGTTADAEAREVEAAARILGLQLVIFNTRTPQAIDDAFAAMVRQRIAALVVNPDSFLNSRRDQIIALAARHSIPTMYSNREYVRAGGLMS
jgi:putative tryptophan/tyrosine transport system substrate-binding protein